MKLKQILFLLVLSHFDICAAQTKNIKPHSCSISFDAKYWYDNLEAQVAGDFPKCDSCYLVIIDKKSRLINNDFKVTHFFLEYFDDRKYLFSVPHPGEKFNDFDKEHLASLYGGDFVRVVDLYVQCKKCKEECTVVLPPFELPLWGTK